MTTFGEYSQLVGDIYAAATEPHRWDHALREISRAMGGNGAAMLSTHAELWSIDHGTLPPEAARAYAEHYIRLDNALAAVMTGPVGAIRTGCELVTPWRHREFYTDWLHPYDMVDALYVRISGPAHGVSSRAFLVHTDDERVPFDTPERTTLLRGLVVHLQQALAIQHDLAAADRDDVSLEDAMTLCGNGLLAVGADATELDANAVAERMLCDGDGLAVRGGRLVATTPDSDQLLRQSIRVATTAEPGDVRRASACRCARPSGRARYLIRVVPLANDAGPRPAAVVVITDPERDLLPDAATLRELFGLTAAEAEVAVHVALGESPREIAEALSVSFNTVRTHLSRVFDKTDTHRQAELVRLLAKLGW